MRQRYAKMTRTERPYSFISWLYFRLGGDVDTKIGAISSRWDGEIYSKGMPSYSE